MKGLLRDTKIKKTIYRTFIFITLFMNKTAFAGPPFLTDDPEPIDYHHYEIYLFSTLDKNDMAVEEPQLQSPALEMNWGAMPNLQLHLIIPFAWSLPPAAPAAHGLGDMEVGFQYRFIQETNDRPQIGIYPMFELPTGNTNQNLGNGKLWMKLPIWLKKSWGKWTSYGGVGYALNSAIYMNVAMRNYPYAGWLLQRNINEHLILGVEIFSQGAVSQPTRPFTIINAGGYYNFTKNFSLLFSAGHSVSGEQHLASYLGLYWTGGD
jgi:hypothetical protein